MALKLKKWDSAEHLKTEEDGHAPEGREARRRARSLAWLAGCELLPSGCALLSRVQANPGDADRAPG